jgi:predicted nucleic acid-binding protein
MISVDTNLLLYSLNPASEWHDRAVEFLRKTFGVPSVKMAITNYVMVDLNVHLRNPVIMAHPLSASKARDLVTSYLKIPNVMRIENANVMDRVWEFDARLALTLRRGGVTHFATANVKDFLGWGFQKVWNPLLS